jgi:hypothetical protein
MERGCRAAREYAWALLARVSVFLLAADVFTGFVLMPLLQSTLPVFSSGFPLAVTGSLLPAALCILLYRYETPRQKALGIGAFGRWRAGRTLPLAAGLYLAFWLVYAFYAFAPASGLSALLSGPGFLRAAGSMMLPDAAWAPLLFSRMLLMSLLLPALRRSFGSPSGILLLLAVFWALAGARFLMESVFGMPRPPASGGLPQYLLCVPLALLALFAAGGRLLDAAALLLPAGSLLYFSLDYLRVAWKYGAAGEAAYRPELAALVCVALYAALLALLAARGRAPSASRGERKEESPGRPAGL